MTLFIAVPSGRSGIRPDKTEATGQRPAGCFALSRVIYRQDRLNKPNTVLPLEHIKPSDGWCDAPDDPAYNSLVTLRLAS